MLAAAIGLDVIRFSGATTGDATSDCALTSQTVLTSPENVDIYWIAPDPGAAIAVRLSDTTEQVDRLHVTVLPHHRVYYMQFAMALSLGALLSRLPDLQLKFDLTEGQLGLLLVALSSGVLIGMTFTSRLVERFGARSTAFVTIFSASTLYALVPWMPSALAVVPLFLVAGLAQGAFEINANIEADRRESLLGYRIMSRTHGMWSVGFFVTALFGAAARQASMSIELHMFIVLMVVLITGSLMLTKVENAPARPGSHDGDTPLVALPTLGLLPLCLVGAAPLLGEGAGIDWSAIYMRDVFAVEPFVGGLASRSFPWRSLSEG